ncbi:DUF4861 domain-containing protein [Duganella sp. BJB488]|uniref:DUF4861 family protein n=1 Tax=unclassified Duganella TaxID=2636909 RepID=UPI000E353126|nr:MULTISPECIES: DUF4861 family protein [unclassified Duganella]RFP14019.1 DUF4861 domain-containing protein [Duganella sp. BJB489]RFP17397.1 DUF4861 domain-containing protein [Duganella sp. BJB488]RFP31813.1 DUF4861 domain-containing protein [Duganella sp. BJB480]
MQPRYLLMLALAGTSAGAAERLAVTATHELDAARPAETIAIPWSEVNQALPGALLQRLTVRDAAGRSLPYQVTNVAPEAKDPQGKGIAYGELIFQHDFAAGEHSASFTVEKSESVAPPFPVQAFARYVPERLDDFAWENDRIAHRTYGQALAAPDSQGSGKEVLVTSGLDIWFKRVRYPIVDRWYNKGHDHYHKDEGEGLDMYGVGTTRGAGGTGIWDGKQLYTSRNYAKWKVIANGPIRAIFELSYDAWDAAGAKVSEVKRFTVDAGHDFDQIDSTFSFSGPASLTAAIGLNKTPAYAHQEPKVAATPLPAARALTQWVTQRNAGDFGVAIVLPSGEPAYAADAANELILAPVRPGQPLRYYVGAIASWSGEVGDAAAWQRRVTAFAARLRAPVSLQLRPLP